VANFILVHGAMHGGWCWERIVPLLEREGHSVAAPDLPGLGQDRTPAAQVTLPGWGRFVAATLERGQGRTILVGHSLGGIAISQAADYAPHRIAALVYLSAVLPRDGVSAVDLTRGGDAAADEERLKMLPSPDGQCITLDPAETRTFLYGDTSEEWFARALSRMVPQPLEVMRTPLRLSAGRFGAVPRVYIECLRDRVLPLLLQRSMQASTPCQSVFRIDTDHSPFYSAPEALVAHLLTIAAQFG
jgi:pimeloyl-ACP methyl ester carboxylesterase